MPVVSNGRELRGRITADVDRCFAEAIRILPISSRRQEVDPDRQPVELMAALRVGNRDETNLAGGMAASWKSRLSAGKAQVSIDRFRYPDLVIRSGDKIVALDRHGEPIFQVIEVNDRGETRLIVELGDA